MWWRRKLKDLGRYGETLAARRLKRSGYRIIARNVRLGRKEIDLIAQDGDTVVFVEVRTRRSADPVPPEDSIGKRKRAHIREAADHYIARYGSSDMYFRFDIVAITVPETGKPDVKHYRDAFQAR